MAFGTSANFGIVVTSKTSQAASGLKGLSGQASSFEKNLGRANKAALILGGSLVSALAAGTVGAMNFEARFAEVLTLVGPEADASMAMLRSGLLELAGGMGDLDTMTQAAYQAISAGVAPAAALGFVEQAAKLAAVGLTDTFTATDALARIMNAFAREGVDAGKAADSLFQIVKGGITTLDQIGPVIGRVAEMTAQSGVSIDELSATLAVLTRAFKPEEAVTNFRQLLLSILAPMDGLKAVLAKAGFETGKMALQTIGLTGVLKLMMDATDGDVGALKEMTGQVQGSSAAAILMSDDMAVFNEQLLQAQNNLGLVNTELDTIQKTAKFQFRDAWVKMKTILVEVGLELLPVITDKIQEWNRWLKENRKQILETGQALARDFIPFLLVVLNKGQAFAEWLVTNGRALVGFGKGLVVALAAANVIRWTIAIKAATKAAGGLRMAFAGGNGLLLALAAVAIGTQILTSKLVSYITKSHEAKAAVAEQEAASRLLHRILRDGLTPELEELLSATDKVTLAQLEQQALMESRTSGDLPATNAILRELILHLRDVEEGTEDSSDAASLAAEIQRLFADELGGVGDAAGETTEELSKLEEMEKALGITTERDLMDKLNKLTILVLLGETPPQKLREAWEDLNQEFIDAGRVTPETAARMERLTATIKKQGGALPELTLSVSDYVDGVEDAKEVSVEFEAGLPADGGPPGKFWGTMSNMVIGFGQVALDVIGNVFGVQIPGFITAGLNSAVQFLQGNIVGGIMSAVSALAGVFTTLFKSKDQIRQERAIKNFGQLGVITNELAEQIAKLSIELSGAGRALPDTVAGLLSLGDVLRETGIPNAKAMTFALVRAREATERFNDGTITETELIKILNDVVPILGENLDLLDATGAMVFREMIQNTREAGLEIAELTALVDQLTREGADNVNSFAATFDDLATASEADLELLRSQFSLMAGEMVANGASIFEVLEAFAPVIQQANESGIELGGTFGFLQRMAVLLADEGIAKVVTRQDAVNGMLATTAKLGLMTQERFNEMGASTTANFERLVELTGNETDALLLMAPSLVSLRDLAEEYGFELDAGLQALIDQGEEAGVVGARQETTNEIMGDMRDILLEIARVFGVDMKDAAKEWGDETVDQAKKVAKEIGKIPQFNPDASGSGDTDVGTGIGDDEGFWGARGGVLPQGGPFRLTAHAKEMVLPRKISEFILDRVGGGTGSSSSASTVINLNVASATFSDPLSRKREAQAVARELASEIGLRGFISGGG